MTSYYLQGSGTRNDAIFDQLVGNRMHVLVERGVTGCIDEVMATPAARKLWRELLAEGWQQVAKPRRRFDQLKRNIAD
jgi:hypothetical protein